MKILILEDDSTRINIFKQLLIGHSLTICTTAKQAIDKLSTDLYDECYLDHDLSDEHYGNQTGNFSDTGYTVSLFLEQNPQINKDCLFIVHSLNDYGATKMMYALRNRKSARQSWLDIVKNV